MSHLSRRKLLTTSGLFGLGALIAGCTVNSGNGTTTATLDVATVDKYGQATNTILAAIAADAPIAAALGPKLIAVQTDVASAATALQNFDTATNGKVSVSINTTSVTGFVSSLLSDAEEVVDDVDAVAGSLIGGDLSNVQTWLSALQTLLPLLSLAIGLAAAPKAVRNAGPPMSESQALAVAAALKHA